MNEIHPTVIIEGDVELGENNRILAYSVLIGPLRIGDDNIIGPNVVIGSPGQDTRNPRYDCSGKHIVIGSHNIIREFTAVQKPAYEDLTSIGNHVFIMHNVHVPHDARIGDRVVITPMVAIAGLAKILEGATLSMGAQIHQRSVIGQYAIVGMGAAVMKNIKPFSRYIPGKPLSVNDYAIEKFGFGAIAEEIRGYVINGTQPADNKLEGIVAAFERLHDRSGRPLAN